MSKKVTLKPVSMRRPSDDFVYSPSKLRSTEEVTEAELNANYTEQEILVSFDKDGVSNPVRTPVYSKISLFGRFIKK